MRKKLILAAMLCFALAAMSAALLRDKAAQEEEGFLPLLRMSGALRIFAMDALWLQMSAHLQEGREGLVLSTARTLLSLDPQSPKTRAFLHRHLAFTMARKAAEDMEKEEWIREGLEIVDEALKEYPDSVPLNRALGMSFFVRTEVRDMAFDRVCLERYGRKPVELAPFHLGRACAGEGGERTRLFWIASLMNAAYFEMNRARFAEAARLWQQVLSGLPAWHAWLGEETDRTELVEHYQGLRAYCLEMCRAKKDEESRSEDVK
ncbi:MAG: hypothetical protein ACYTG7_24725 [Planctomycetota bacterium]|jgi:hypothetical protein